MFTGVIAATGIIEQITTTAYGYILTISSKNLDFNKVKLGDSMAVNGACLTINHLPNTMHQNKRFCVELSQETLRCTTFAQYGNIGQKVNLEQAMLATDRFDGHIVTGHVDATAKVCNKKINGQNCNLWIETSKETVRYLAEKGSVTIDGISLTVNEIQECKFRITLISYTLGHTIAEQYTTGSLVNLEVDIIARYLERLMLGSKSAITGKTKHKQMTTGYLAKHGFW